MTIATPHVEPEVWVWLPRERERQLAPSAAELLYEGGALARRLGARLVALCDVLPDGPEQTWLRRWGVERLRPLGVTLPQHPQCSGGRSPLLPLVRQAAAAGVEVRAVLLAADPFGRAVAPLLAAELAADCVTAASGVTAGGEHLVIARPVLGEQYEALVRLPATRPVVVTLLPGAVGDVAPPAVAAAGAADAAPHAAHRDAPLQGEPQVAPPPVADALPAAAPAVYPPDAATLDVADAERIVAFGRGAFAPEAVRLVERLAQALGATVAGTRPAADEGWLPFARQVGLTGAIVRPRLYVAVGLSGAPYHMVGVKEPQTLIAINSDPEAPIFGHAHLGLVGDLYALLPALLARLERGAAPEPAAAELATTGEGRP